MKADSEFTIHPKLAADTLEVADLELSKLLLMNNAHYPWCILVPRVVGAREWLDLNFTQQHALLDESNRVARAMLRLFDAHKINIAALGNVVSQLHVHVVGRYQNDPAWPGPVWGHTATQTYTPLGAEKMIDPLREALKQC
jgi:diadenosine tetraphosphate (Ap4A) HIT family hydrolase